MKKDNGWNPYLAGALSGFVSIGSIWFVGKYLGASTTFVRAVGMLENIVSPERVATMPYFLKTMPVIDWQWVFVLGIGVGSFLAAISSGNFRWQGVPDMWQGRFGSSPWLRGGIAFIGGIIAIFGARLADGCPSGHGLSGLLQLAVSGFIAIIFFFIGGMMSANWLYKGGGKR